jgi:ubiquinone/menaquinone biosynthesis C-methylase UbiE
MPVLVVAWRSDITMTTEQIRAAYNQVAQQYAAVNTTMAATVAAAAERFLRLTGHDAHILDVSCGADLDMAWFEAQGMQVIGIDLSRGMLAQARRRVRGRFLQMDMRSLAFRAGRFQGIWCSASLLHVRKCEAFRVLAEFQRVLVPRGVLFLALQEGIGEIWESSKYDDGIEIFFGVHCPRTDPESGALAQLATFHCYSGALLRYER